MGKEDGYMRVIISTMGTSVFTNISRSNPDMSAEYQAFIKGRADKEGFKEKVMSCVMQSADVSKISAEVNSLDKLDIKDEDVLYLIATDTCDGELAAEILKAYLENKRINSNIFIEKIKDLQVEDAVKFERTGIKLLFEKIGTIMDRYIGAEVIFNITGGFKGVVPYITIAGMLYKRQIAYIFERTTSLITLPMIPLDFDFSTVEKYYKKLSAIRDEMQSEKDFYDGISFDERADLDTFCSHEDGLVYLTTVGEMILKRYEQMHTKLTVYMSSEANNYYNSRDNGQRKTFNVMMRRVYDPSLRLQNMHKKMKNTDCCVYKQPNTAERMFYAFNDNDLYVYKFEVNHDNYEQELKLHGIYKNRFSGFKAMEIEGDRL